MHLRLRARISRICGAVAVGLIFVSVSAVWLHGQTAAITLVKHSSKDRGTTRSSSLSFAANNSSRAAPFLRPPNKSPDLTLVKTHVGDFTRGQTGATYTLTVANVGSAATSGAVTGTGHCASRSGGDRGNRQWLGWRRERLRHQRTNGDMHAERSPRRAGNLSGDHSGRQRVEHRASERHEHSDRQWRRREQHGERQCERRHPDFKHHGYPGAHGAKRAERDDGL